MGKVEKSYYTLSKQQYQGEVLYRTTKSRMDGEDSKLPELG